MSFERAPYPREFCPQPVELVRSGRTPEELSREFEPSAHSIHDGRVRPALDHPCLKTPKLHRLARESVLFRRHYPQALHALVLRYIGTAGDHALLHNN